MSQTIVDTQRYPKIPKDSLGIACRSLFRAALAGHCLPFMALPLPFDLSLPLCVHTGLFARLADDGQVQKRS